MDYNPAVSARDVRRRILDTVTPTENFIPYVKTGGRLNMAKLMGRPIPPDPVPYRIDTICGLATR